MTQHKTSSTVYHPYPMGILALLLVVALAGCADLRTLNPEFLDTFQPFGIDSIIYTKGEGSVIVVVENLTRAACYDEFADVVLTYSGTSASGSVLIPFLPAVPEQERPGNSSYRRTVVLNCGDVDTVSIQATIHRKQITEEELPEIFSGTREVIRFADEKKGVETLSIMPGAFTQPMGDVVVQPAKVVKVDLSQEELFSAVNTFGGFSRDIHFQCGGVLVFAIMDEVRPDGRIQLQDRDSEYTFMSFTTERLQCASGAEIALLVEDLPEDERQEAINILTIWTTEGEDALTEEQLAKINEFRNQDSIRAGYFEDPTQDLLDFLLPYPEMYIVIGISLPTIDIVDVAGPLLLDQAIQASKGLDTR